MNTRLRLLGREGSATGRRASGRGQGLVPARGAWRVAWHILSPSEQPPSTRALPGGQAWLGGVGLGAGLMYFLDPHQGRRRRALVRDQLVHLLHTADDALGTTSRDLRHRARGMVAGTGARFRNEEVIDDVLVARVRSKIGRVVSHPHAIEVSADAGRVTLRGPVLRDEVDDLLAAVASVRGVLGVDNRLAVRDQARDIPGLQGGAARPGEQFELRQEYWSPTARLLVGGTGGGLAFYGVRRGGPAGVAAGAVGLGLLARAVTNMDLPRLLGRRGHRAIDIQKTLNVAAPIGDVFTFWSRFENFPRFMAHVREVRDLGDGRSHWVVEGPAGISVAWDAVITRLEPNKVLAWKSTPGSLIATAGSAYFEQTEDGGTRVTIRLTYNPPTGALGHVVAMVFGADPKREIDDDLVRFKSLLETGRVSGGGRAVTREEVASTPPASGATPAAREQPAAPPPPAAPPGAPAQPA